MGSALFQAEDTGAAVLLRFTCPEFDHDKTQKLKSDLAACFEQHADKSCIADISAVEFMPSPTLGALVEAHLSLKKSDRRFIVAAPNDQIAKLFNHAGLDKLLKICPTTDAAMAELQD